MMIAKTASWMLEIAVFLAVLFAVQIPLRKKELPLPRAIVFILKAVMIPGSALLFVAIESRFSYRHGDVLAALYVVLLGDAAASVLEYAIRRLGQPRDRSAGKRPCQLGLLGLLSAVCCLGVFLYGTANVGHVAVKTHTWTAQGLTRTHTFAFAADLHIGSAQSADTLEEFCRQVNAADPEFVILGGDITDELTSYDAMTAGYRILSEIEAPVYFVYGNHDRQPNAQFFGGRTYSDEQLTQTIRDAGIRILTDEYVKAADDLILLGREDIGAGDGRKAWEALDDPFEGTGALIVADHQPYDEEQLAAERSALQLSGHTHAGQFWPLQLVYRLLGLPAYGEFEEPGTLLYVTAGEGVWMMPLRTEAHCEWDLITLVP